MKKFKKDIPYVVLIVLAVICEKLVGIEFLSIEWWAMLSFVIAGYCIGCMTGIDKKVEESSRPKDEQIIYKALCECCSECCGCYEECRQGSCRTYQNWMGFLEGKQVEE